MTKYPKKALYLAIIFGFGLNLAAVPCLAQDLTASVPGFKPYAILDDRDIFDIGSMNLQSIQDFLDEHGILGQTKQRDIDGQLKSVATIVWRVATSYKINPRYLLALLQKEQSLVEDLDPTQKQLDWAAGYGVCDSCAMSDPAIQNFKGFANQLEYAAKQHREKYLFQILGKGTTIAGYAPGKVAIIDGQPIIPANQATAMLYSYTPHLLGNINLWKIWQRWFALAFPDGTVVRGKTTNRIFLIDNGQRRRISSMAVAATLVDPSKIVTAEDSQLAGYADGKDISFPNYSLVETPDGKRYLISGKTKRLIASLATFNKLGFNEDEIIEATSDELVAYADGPDILTANSYPTGLLIKDSIGKYWYVEDGVRHAIPHTAFLTLYFKGRPAKLVTDTKLKTFKIGDVYALHDGELVRTATKPDVFVIENGSKRPIPSSKTFLGMGWSWKNVITLSDKVLKDYPVGIAVDLHPTNTQLANTTTSTTPILAAAP